MSKKYFEHLFWAKYSAITIALGVLVGMIGYQNLTVTPFSVLRSHADIIDIKRSSEFTAIVADKSEPKLYMKRSDAKYH